MPTPDPLVTARGERVTNPEAWRSTRRAELLRLYEEEVFGKTLLGRPDEMRFAVREEKPGARGGRATRLRVGILFEGRDDGRQMELLVYLPSQASGPAPLFLGLNFDGNYTTTTEPDLPLPTHPVTGLFQDEPVERLPTEARRAVHAHMWPYDAILERGYGIATASYTEVEPDEAGRWRDGPRGLAPEPGERGWGAIGAWAWALGRAMDYLETDPRVDASRVSLFGFSRMGKTALWAGAQDERFAMVVSQQAGKGGVSITNRGVGEPIAHLVDPLGYWFARSYAKYANDEGALPVNGHLLASLIAPRPLLILSGSEDAWSDPEGEFLGGLGASPVYELLGERGLAARSWPRPGALVPGTVGYYLRAGPHDVTAEDWAVTLGFADEHLR